MTKRQYPYNVVDMVFAGLDDADDVEFKPKEEELTLRNLIESLIFTLPQEWQHTFLLYAREGMALCRIAESEKLPLEDVEDMVGRTFRYLRHPNRSQQLVGYLK